MKPKKATEEGPKKQRRFTCSCRDTAASFDVHKAFTAVVQGVEPEFQFVWACSHNSLATDARYILDLTVSERVVTVQQIRAVEFD